MTRLFINTHIVLNGLAKGHPSYYSVAKLGRLADRKFCALSGTSLTLANTHSVLAESKSATQSTDGLRKLAVLLQVLPLHVKEVDLALNDGGIKGGKTSRIPEMRPQEFPGSLP